MQMPPHSQLIATPLSPGAPLRSGDMTPTVEIQSGQSSAIPSRSPTPPTICNTHPVCHTHKDNEPFDTNQKLVHQTCGLFITEILSDAGMKRDK